MLIFFSISQIIGSAVLLALTGNSYEMQDVYYSYSVVLTGISGLVTMIPAVFLYRRDRNRRVYGCLISDPPGVSLTAKESGMMLLLGAGSAFYVNLFMGMLQQYLDHNVYKDMMDRITEGQSLWVMILWMGIVAPIAEEMIFRWLIYLRLRDHMGIWGAAVLSAAVFGVFHGNLLQAVYAGILGVLMAYILEMSGNIWSCVLIHIGANVFSLILSEAVTEIVQVSAPGAVMAANMAILLMYGVLLAAVIIGITYFRKKGKKRGYRAI